MFLNNEPDSTFLEKFRNGIQRFFKINSSTRSVLEISENVDNQSINDANSMNDVTSQSYPGSNVSKPLLSTNLRRKITSSMVNQNSSRFSPPKLALSLSGNKTSRALENSKQQVVSITYEEIGLFPRSFNRVFDRFFKQLFFDVDNLVIQEYRFYRYLFLTTVKCVFILLFVPLAINFVAKNYLVRPITEYYWNTSQSEIFLNSYQQKRAFTELQEFEEKLYFESLVLTYSSQNSSLHVYTKKPHDMTPAKPSKNPDSTTLLSNKKEFVSPQMTFEFSSDSKSVKPVSYSNDSSSVSSFGISTSYNKEIFSESVQNRLHEKIIELAIHYNEESVEAITNFFADLISFVTLCYLFFALEIQINITKSFLLEVFFGLDDSKKSLFILFVTDLLVGYHSPNIWELFFSSFFDHYGLPENQTTIFLLVATLPVLLDVLFKYLIFRHLNRASPATVATYHAMIE